MRHSNKERDNVAESRPGSNTVRRVADLQHCSRVTTASELDLQHCSRVTTASELDLDKKYYIVHGSKNQLRL